MEIFEILIKFVLGVGLVFSFLFGLVLVGGALLGAYKSKSTTVTTAIMSGLGIYACVVYGLYSTHIPYDALVTPFVWLCIVGFVINLLIPKGKPFNSITSLLVFVGTIHYLVPVMSGSWFLSVAIPVVIGMIIVLTPTLLLLGIVNVMAKILRNKRRKEQLLSEEKDLV